MLRIHTAERLDPLADHLAGVLSRVPADPMSTEWIAAPSQAMHRWLSLRLASTLGAGSAGRPDGVSANIRFAYPGSLMARVLDAGMGPDHPWDVERLAWFTLMALDRSQTDPGVGSRYARARRIADLFDRYNVHRPAMIRDWAAGHDTDGTGRPLPSHHCWQPALWRQVRDLIGVESPAELMPEILDHVASGEIDPALPERLFMFGLTVVPGGAGFIDLAEAVGSRRELHLYLVEPSAKASALLRGSATVDPDSEVLHPLLASWARPSISTSQILGSTGRSTDPVEAPADEGTSDSLLGRLQHQIRSNAQPEQGPLIDPTDQSIQVHACYGNTRQVEALRDSILGLLAFDPTLGEDDILVLTPALDTFAPMIEAAFGPPAEQGHTPRPTSLRYRIADRSIRYSNPVLAATTTLLEMATGRFEVDSVLDFMALGPVRERFDLDPEELAGLAAWAEATNVKWGLDTTHRERHGLPASISSNTWQAAVDQLMLGSTIITHDSSLAIGSTAVEGIEGSLVGVAAKLAAIVKRLSDLSDSTESDKTITEWIDLLVDTQQALLAAPRGQSWQVDNLRAVLAELADSAAMHEGMSPPLLSFDDFRRAVTSRLEGRSGRPDFFRGGITITSMRPMRWIPHRVICVLGIDQGSFADHSANGDDLIALSPILGDFDSRGDSRQAMLEAVLAAGDHLLIFRNGHDIRTNVEIPRTTVIEELLDSIAPSVASGTVSDLHDRFEIRHPRQSFDERCFTKGAILPGEIMGFDADAFRGAQARRSRGPVIPVRRSDPPVDVGPGLVELDELRSLLRNPSRHHTDRVLQIKLPRANEPLSALLPIDPDGLQRWSLGDTMINAAIGHADRSTEESLGRIASYERHKGSIPPAGLGDMHEQAVRSVSREVLDAAAAFGVARGPVVDHPVDIQLADGTRVVGVVASRLDPAVPGPALITYSSWKATHLTNTWLDLMCLVATRPDTPWRAITINPIDGKEPKGAEVWVITPRADDPAERRAAAITSILAVIECLRANLTQPIPLFPEVSRGFYIETHQQSDLADPGTSKYRFDISKKWHDSFRGMGDRSDPAADLLWGDLELHDLRGLANDPVQFWADHLWGAIDHSINLTSSIGAPT